MEGAADRTDSAWLSSSSSSFSLSSSSGPSDSSRSYPERSQPNLCFSSNKNNREARYTMSGPWTNATFHLFTFYKLGRAVRSKRQGLRPQKPTTELRRGTRGGVSQSGRTQRRAGSANRGQRGRAGCRARKLPWTAEIGSGP